MISLFLGNNFNDMDNVNTVIYIFSGYWADMACVNSQITDHYFIPNNIVHLVTTYY